MQVVWLEAVLDMLDENVAYVAEDDPTAASRMRSRILDQVGGVAEFPYRGRPGRVSGTRELVVTGAPFLVAYRFRGDEVQVLAVLHGARQWPEAFDT